MDPLDTVELLAMYNAARARKMRRDELDEIGGTVPFFEIKRRPTVNAFCVELHNHASHPNRGRFDLWKEYLESRVLPALTRHSDVCGCYRMELHDSYAYLNNDEDYSGVLTFAGHRKHAGPVLVPDPYMIMGYHGENSFQDPMQYTQKDDRVVFRGSSTGDVRADRNFRIDLCRWAANAGNAQVDLKITSVVQMAPGSVPDLAKISAPNMSQGDQCKSKMLLNLDGNTAKYGVWQYMTNSLVLKHQSDHVLWYSPLVQRDQHFVQVTRDTLENTRRLFASNVGHAQLMINNANLLFRRVLTLPSVHELYTKVLLESMGENAS